MLCAMAQGLHLRSAVWKQRHWRATVERSMPAENLKFLVFPSGGHANITSMDSDRPLSATVTEHNTNTLTYSDIGLSLSSPSLVLHGTRSLERYIMVVMCPLGHSWHRWSWCRKSTWTKPRSKPFPGHMDAAEAGPDPRPPVIPVERREGWNDVRLENSATCTPVNGSNQRA